MPNGYLVVLGNGSLDPGDAIVDGLTFFTTQVNLGAGVWVWSGTFGGTTYTNTQEPGVYYLATDGNVYFVPDFGPVDTITSASVVSAPSYADDPTDNQVDGTGGADIIDATYTDAQGDQIDDGSGYGPGGLGDYVLAGGGDDLVQSGLGDDLVLGDAGADTLEGGSGNDTIYGDGSAAGSQSETLVWTDEGGNNADLSPGFTQNTGLIDVTVTFTDDGNNNPTFEVDTQNTYVAGGENFDPNSSLEMFGNGDASTSTTTLNFAAATSGTAEDEVSDVSFRINDVDWASGNHRDIIEVNAYDADGNLVPVVFTPGGGDTIVGNTITAEDILETPDDLGGSVLIEIAGPVANVDIIYSNGLGGTQAINISDIHFEAMPISDVDDSILGGAGDDLAYGGAGDDTVRGNAGSDTLFGGAGADLLAGGSGDDLLNAGGGDTVRGGSGDDLFVINTSELDGTGITIVGGETGETAGDTLDLTGVLVKGSIVYTNTDDDAGGLSGSATLIDGTVVTFSAIETVICFALGTQVLTPRGERPIEILRRGDMVNTLDHGPRPIKWIGQKTVRATGALAPICFQRGSIGNNRDLYVSPQHRMLKSGYETQLHFGEKEVLAPARSLVDNLSIHVAYGGMVTYYHMLFDDHEIVFANGTASESFHPGGFGLDTLHAPAREEVFSLFPALRSDPNGFGPTSRPSLKPRDARVFANISAA